MEEEIQTQKTLKQKLDEIFNKYRLYIALFLISFVVSSGSVLMVQGASVDSSENDIIKSEDLLKENKEDSEDKSSDIVFDIEGAVENPGVYRLPAGSVMNDGIEAAGGLSHDADNDRIARELNKASPIGNNAKLYLFKKSDNNFKLVVDEKESTNSLGSEKTASKISAKININTADLIALDSLPGIGPAIGQRIIDWRDANGGYEVLEDIKKVKGIGDSLYDGIRDLITVE